MTGLVIGGLTPFSTVDWPGKLVATVFLQGCPWNCAYCHNYAIIDPNAAGNVPEQELWNLLQRRAGLLDAVVFSGGEPTRQPGIITAAQNISELGFAIGMHTGGAYPHRLAQMLNAKLLDWVGLDIKALPENYPQATGVKSSKTGHNAWQSLQLILQAFKNKTLQDYEVRVTAYPGNNPQDTNASNTLKLAEKLYTAGVEKLAVQLARPQGTRQSFAEKYNPNFPEELAKVCENISQLGFPSFTYRH